MNASKRKIALIAALVLLTSSLTGCSSSDKTATNATAPTATATVIPTTAKAESASDAVPASAEVAVTNPLIAAGLDEKQLNSINMLNHLVVLTQEINASKHSRLYLEEAYSTLLNNTSPEAVDPRTQTEINYLLNTLESYRMIAVKRDRLQYIYEQNQAQALRDAIPNPLGLMSAVQSFSLSKMIASVVYMAVDSYTSYESSSAQADLEYLQDGWALDDEQATTLHEIRKGTFNYMIETVRDYDLPGELSLTEKAVSDYVEWKNKSNNLQVIQFFEENVDTYRAFGPYWLTLAECYYENGDYAKCLEAIGAYEQLQTQIFRRDYAYARVLPLGVVAAAEVYDKNQYVETATRYVESIQANTDNDDWTLRYFAAQTYIELYSITGKDEYLREAYDIALNNVNYLIDDQIALNEAYMADVVEAVADKGATDAQKDEIKSYNKMLKEERKTALPPVHEPLMLNCELLFSLASEIGIDESENLRIDGILHENGAALFLAEPIDMLYRTNGDAYTIPASSIAYENGTITVPAQYVTDSAAITVTITRNGEETVFEDWTIDKVERKDKADLSTFIATYASKAAKDFKFVAGDTMHIEITPKEGSSAYVLSCDYNIMASKTLYFFDSVEFQRAE